MRLIDADRLKEMLLFMSPDSVWKLSDVIANIDNSPTAGQSITHAHWKWDGKSKDYNCSRCDYQGKMTLFCPDCGVSMDGKQEPEITISCKLTNCEYNESGNCSARRIDRDGMCFTQRTEINDNSEEIDDV